MVSCERQEDSSLGDIWALDKLIWAYDDPDVGEDVFG
jgi:hypothetical protein